MFAVVFFWGERVFAVVFSGFLVFAVVFFGVFFLGERRKEECFFFFG